MKHFYSIIIISGLIFTSCANEQQKETYSNRSMNEGMDTTGTSRDTVSINDRKEDSTFLVQALSGGVMEIRLGELAIKMSKRKSTQQLGKMMIQEHSKSNEEIIQLLQQQEITLNDTLIKLHASKIKDFEKEKIADFDAKYIKEMQKDHRENISRFESQLSKTNNTTVKDFVNRMLPVLRNHQNHIETLVKEEM
ncbi:MAG: DUF4142 domain-containing protein [Flavihumibacter sp.]|nr:DUF4142 domain-containing protein [Flavihumibacter sp.]